MSDHEQLINRLRRCLAERKSLHGDTPLGDLLREAINALEQHEELAAEAKLDRDERIEAEGRELKAKAKARKQERERLLKALSSGETEERIWKHLPPALKAPRPWQVFVAWLVAALEDSDA